LALWLSDVPVGKPLVYGCELRLGGALGVDGEEVVLSLWSVDAPRSVMVEGAKIRLLDGATLRASGELLRTETWVPGSLLLWSSSASGHRSTRKRLVLPSCGRPTCRVRLTEGEEAAGDQWRKLVASALFTASIRRVQLSERAEYRVLDA